MRQDSAEGTNMKKRLFGLVKWLARAKLALEFLNELIAFVEKVYSYIHVALNYYCLSWDKSSRWKHGSINSF